MVIVVQVAVEYGALASGSSSKPSLGQTLDRLLRAVEPEHIAIGVGVLLVLYLLRKAV